MGSAGLDLDGGTNAFAPGTLNVGILGRVMAGGSTICCCGEIKGEFREDPIGENPAIGVPQPLLQLPLLTEPSAKDPSEPGSEEMLEKL